MELFTYKQDKVEVSPIVLTIPLFKKLHDRDKSKGKINVHKELSYIYFMCDYKSDFNDILDETKRNKEIGRVLFNDENYQPDELIKECMLFYKQRQETLSSHLLEGAKTAIGKIDSFFRDLDLTKLDEKGKPIYNVSQITTTINKLGETVKGLKELEDVVKKEREEAVRARGGGTLGMFEDPD